MQEWFQTDFVTIDIVKLYRTFLGDRKKGLKLRHFGKLNFTYHGKVWRCSSSSTAAIYIAAMAAVEEPQAAVDKGEKESLVYCGLSTAAVI